MRKNHLKTTIIIACGAWALGTIGRAGVAGQAFVAGLVMGLGCGAAATIAFLCWQIDEDG